MWLVTAEQTSPRRRRRCASKRKAGETIEKTPCEKRLEKRKNDMVLGSGLGLLRP